MPPSDCLGCRLFVYYRKKKRLFRIFSDLQERQMLLKKSGFFAVHVIHMAGYTWVLPQGREAI